MRRAAVLLVLALAASACGSTPSTAPRARHAAGLVDVSSVFPVRGAFNRDAGKKRLLVLLSPT
jgi:hypothetical protein